MEPPPYEQDAFTPVKTPREPSAPPGGPIAAGRAVLTQPSLPPAQVDRGQVVHCFQCGLSGPLTDQALCVHCGAIVSQASQPSLVAQNSVSAVEQPLYARVPSQPSSVRQVSAMSSSASRSGPPNDFFRAQTEHTHVSSSAASGQLPTNIALNYGSPARSQCARRYEPALVCRSSENSARYTFVPAPGVSSFSFGVQVRGGNSPKTPLA